MTIYTANKPCKFNGREFAVGDTIPAELIATGRAKALVEYKAISVAEVADVPSEKKDEAAGATNAANDQQPDAATETATNAANEGRQAKTGEGEQSDDQRHDENAEKPKATGKKGAKK